MFTNAWRSLKTNVLSRGHLVASKTHFNFIWAHYIWIIVCIIVSSILLFAGGRGNISYIDALLFASGANTQAGLNPVDVNELNTFQQIVMYIFPMMSNPITVHGFVVILRLYWFEKRFQGLVKDVRQRRVPLTRTKSKSRGDELRRAEAGVNVGEITRVAPQNGNPPRLTNDGTLLEMDEMVYSKRTGSSSDESDSTVPHAKNPTPDASQSTHDPSNGTGLFQTAVTFAETVKRSDGVEDDPTNFVQLRPNADHIAILEAQRNQDDEILRIPGPRETEQGLGPQRLDDQDWANGNHALYMAHTRESRPDGAGHGQVRRNATITIAEPAAREPTDQDDDLTDNVQAWRGTLNSLRMRKPRFFNKNQDKVHEDGTKDPADGGPEQGQNRTRTKTLENLRSAMSSRRAEADEAPYLSYTPTMGRNSNFIGLTLEQREELGGIEYRSLRTLMFIILIYYWGFQLLALTFLLPFILHNHFYGIIINSAGVARSWWGFFTSSGAFNDVGFTLTPDSMISFKSSAYVLMVMWFFIIIGNTGFPVMLRFSIWVTSKLVPRGTGLWEELKFLLDHPRRCFTLLFPSNANWWLFLILVVLNVVDLLFFIILDLHSEAVQELSVGARIVNGLFLAASTRTAGFASLPLSELHPAMPVLYMIMMYIGVYPIAISIRRTNVYEEQSLGMYQTKKNDDDDDEDQSNSSPMSFVGNHLRRQLSFDLWFVGLGFFLLAIAEGDKIKKGEFDMFAILFELISAYGTVGLSLGVMGVDASLCSQFSVWGKLIIIAMEIRGRHRGLPYGLDRAVILPSESRLLSGGLPITEQEHLEPFATGPMGRPPTARSNLRRRSSMASTRRGRSLSRDRNNRGIITQLLHPGPVVPPGVVHSHNRTKSSNSQDLSLTMTRGSRRPPSLYPPTFEDDEEDYEDRARARGPALAPTNSRLDPPRRAETVPS